MDMHNATSIFFCERGHLTSVARLCLWMMRLVLLLS